MTDGVVACAVLLALLALAHALGHAFVRLRQPRVIGEILAGALLAPSALALVLPELAAGVGESSDVSLATDGAYGVGLVLLMFFSGARMNGLFAKDDQPAIAWLAAVGTCLPFVAGVALARVLPLEALLGAADHRLALTLVLGIAVAVTSIPVISRIFHDLGLLETRFARLVLGVAVVEDVALWVVLAVALSLARSTGLPWADAARHLGLTLLFVALALTLLPVLFRRAGAWSRNALARRWPGLWLLLLLLASCGLALLFDVSLVFASFFGGLAIGPADAARWRDSLERLSKVAFATAIPAYFAIVGFRLDLVTTFWPVMTAALVLGACLIKLTSVALGARLAGFRGLDVVNLAVATNARGGPGIVLASVALDAAIVSEAGYTSLIVLAVVTSQAAGLWLDLVVRRGWPLLREDRAGPSA
jgi:Kef-type K+ transport system membrane component KefB